uniref:Uncharacterized protein n=1 Tax=Strongyloides papillosus TaxID=174720 RepID=A0A0N5CEP9_STREA
MDTPIDWDTPIREDTNGISSSPFSTPSIGVPKLVKYNFNDKFEKVKIESGQTNDNLNEIKKILEDEKKFDWQRTPFEGIINAASWNGY